MSPSFGGTNNVRIHPRGAKQFSASDVRLFLSPADAPAGVSTGEHEVTHPDKVVERFVVDTQAQYDVLDDNFLVGILDGEDGKPTIVLPSTTGSGISRIVPHLKEGADVVTTRAHVHHVVTEYGSVNLHGKNLRERAEALINIAPPDHRAALQEAAHERFHTTTRP